MTGHEKAVAVQAHRTALDTAETDRHQFSFPAPGTVKGGMLADLLEGQRITHLTVWTRQGSSRAAHFILRLRQSGWPIETHMVDVQASHGRTAHIAEYALAQDVIDAAGEAGRRFVQAVRQGGQE